MDILTLNDRPGQHAPSWYAATTDLPGPYPRAEGEIRVDVAIVGGGYTGLSTALHLARSGVRVAVFEASRVGSGASGRNGGQVSMGFRKDQVQLEAMLGDAGARALWDMGQEAVATVRALIKESGDDCDWTPGIVEAAHRKRFDSEYREYAEHLLDKYNYKGITYLPPEKLADELRAKGYSGGTLNMGEGHIHPLRYASALARLAEAAGVQIYEMSRVLSHAPGPILRTQTSEIRADHVVLAMNGYHGNFTSGLESRVMPINSFVCATEPLSEATARALIPNRYAVADSRFVVNYFRLSPDNRMIFGGSESYGYRFPRDIRGMVKRRMIGIFPQLNDVAVSHAWGGTLGITLSRLPFVERPGPGMIAVGGFSGQGVALATLSGKLVAESLTGHPERLAQIEALPTARFPGGRFLRTPLLVAAMLWSAMRDRL